MTTLLHCVVLLLLPLLLTACFGNHVLIRQESFAVAEQCLKQQQQYQQQFFEQQQQFTQAITQFNHTLEKPLAVNAPVVQLTQQDPVCSTNKPAPVVTPSNDVVSASNKQTVGEIEAIWLPELGLTLQGRIDTGATTASIDARNIQTFERDGEQWIRFNIINPETQQAIAFERKRVRRVRVTQANSTTPESRPVIELQVVIGSIAQSAQFTLSDRSHLDYQALIGRNVLRDVMLVDVSQSHIAPVHKEISP